MKRLKILLVAFILVVTALASGCSCTGDILLPFNNDFNGGSAPTAGYSETLTYKVSLDERYNSQIKRADSLQKSVIDYTIEGTYTSTLTVGTSFPEKQDTLLKKAFDSDLKKDVIKYNLEVYTLHTKLELVATYYLLGDKTTPTVKNDYIENKVYFVKADSSFSPVYSETIEKYSSLGVSDKGVFFIDYDNELSTLYRNETYKMHVKYNNANPAIDQTYQFEYALGTCIDNVQLLFAIRNLGIDKDVSYEMPVVSYQYGEVQNLLIKNYALKDVNVKPEELSVNGSPFDGEVIKLDCIEYNLSSLTRTGLKQYCLVQREASGNLLDKSVLYQYVEPLVTSQTYQCMGALVYTLTSASFSL
ncbi:MAG: hypothetical protein II988_01335 [Clostridia bacterium]|nr:hypothetical protein [Clostridia bacterium]